MKATSSRTSSCVPLPFPAGARSFPFTQYPIRIMRLLGASIAILTNAAGGLNSSLLKVGSIVALVDHVSLPSLVSRRCRLVTAACLCEGVRI